MTERDAVTEAFTDEMREGKDGVLRRTQKEYYRYLVGTTTLLCGCHQLTRACNVVLLEPAHIYHQEVCRLQSFLPSEVLILCLGPGICTRAPYTARQPRLIFVQVN